MGLPVCSPGPCPEYSIEGKLCKQTLDLFGDHAVSCPVGPSRIARHDAINISWMRTTIAAGFQAQREVRLDPKSRRRVADTLVYGWDHGALSAHDWVVAHPLAPFRQARSCANPEVVLAGAESAKTKAAKAECDMRGVQFTPLAMDTFMGFGPSAKSAILQVANRDRCAHGADPEVSAKRIAQRIRFTAMRSVTQQILRRTPPLRDDFFDVAPDERTPQEKGQELPQAPLRQNYPPPADTVHPTQSLPPPGGAGDQTTGGPDNASAQSNLKHPVAPPNHKPGPHAMSMVGDRGFIPFRQAVPSSQVPWAHVYATLEKEWGLRPVELGQGRGGECQFLACLFAANPALFPKGERGWSFQWHLVDTFRGELAKWLEKLQHQKWGSSGMEMWEVALAYLNSLPQFSRQHITWPGYLNLVRRNGWGDQFTLLAVAGVLARPVVVVSVGADGSSLGAYDVSPPSDWGPVKDLVPPIYLLHINEHHYLPLVWAAEPMLTSPDPKSQPLGEVCGTTPPLPAGVSRPSRSPDRLGWNQAPLSSVALFGGSGPSKNRIPRIGRDMGDGTEGARCSYGVDNIVKGLGGRKRSKNRAEIFTEQGTLDPGGTGQPGPGGHPLCPDADPSLNTIRDHEAGELQRQESSEQRHARKHVTHETCTVGEFSTQTEDSGCPSVKQGGRKEVGLGCSEMEYQQRLYGPFSASHALRQEGPHGSPESPPSSKTSPSHSQTPLEQKIPMDWKGCDQGCTESPTFSSPTPRGPQRNVTGHPVLSHPPLAVDNTSAVFGCTNLSQQRLQGDLSKLAVEGRDAMSGPVDLVFSPPMAQVGQAEPWKVVPRPALETS